MAQRRDRQRKRRQSLYNRRIVEPVQSADGEEWYDADAFQPQEYKVPDENLIPTWYARKYLMPFDAVAHAAFFTYYGEGTSWKHSEGSDLQMGSQAERLRRSLGQSAGDL